MELQLFDYADIPFEYFSVLKNIQTYCENDQEFYNLRVGAIPITGISVFRNYVDLGFKSRQDILDVYRIKINCSDSDTKFGLTFIILTKIKIKPSPVNLKINIEAT